VPHAACSISFVSLCAMLFVWGEKGRWNASVLAQKAQVGKRVPLSCTSLSLQYTKKDAWINLVSNKPEIKR
jgi:hypothetical protein